MTSAQRPTDHTGASPPRHPAEPEHRTLNIAVIGGGMTGLATAYYLSRSGCEVTVFEKADEVGGLCRSDQMAPGFRWDRYYHVILTSDRDLLDFLDELGLAPNIRFMETRTGFYTDGALHSMSNSLEFLKFRPLSLWSKMRLAAGILYTTRIKDFTRLEKRYAGAWLTTIFGRRNYEKLWEPLLRSKLGTAHVKASAAFIWACINRYYGTRHEATKKELMGCVDAGYHSILQRIQNVLEDRGVGVRVNHDVANVAPSAGDKLTVHCRNGFKGTFDKVVATVPNPVATRVAASLPTRYKHRINAVDYLSLICVTFTLTRPLSPFYVINITDDDFPFTGIIEASNIVPGETLQGRGLIYLPRYMAAGDPCHRKSDREIIDWFWTALKKVFPRLSEAHVIARHIRRETYVQPIQTVAYSQNIPSFSTPLNHFYIANTSMIVHSTLNNNQVIRIAKDVSSTINPEGFQPAVDTPRGGAASEPAAPGTNS